MAIGKSVFEIAALEHEQTSTNTDENLAEIRIGPNTYTLWRKPTSAQFVMMTVRSTRGSDERWKGIDRFLSGLLLTPEEAVADGRKDIDGNLYSDRVKAGDRFVGIDFLWELYEAEKLDEEQLVKLCEAAIEVHTGFPTESSSASSPGRTESGTTSTAASRRNSSTRSTSR